MKKLIILLTIILSLTTTAFAQVRDVIPYDDIMKELKADESIDWSDIDENEIEVIELLFAVKQVVSNDCNDFFLYLPHVNSEEYDVGGYTISHGYGGTLKSTVVKDKFNLLEDWVKYDKANALSLIEKNGLSKPTKINSMLINDTGMEMFAYNAVCDDTSYIIPFIIPTYGKYNITNSEEVEYEIGRAYTLEEIAEIDEKAQSLYDEYIQKKNAEKEANTYYKGVDENGDVFEHFPEVDEEDTEEKIDEPEKPIIDEVEPDDDDDEVIVDEADDKADNKTDDEEDKEEIEEDDNSEDNNQAVTAKFFLDVPATHWAYGDITELAGKNIIYGYGDGYFGVNDNVTYEHLAMLLKRQFNYDAVNTTAEPAKRGDIIVSIVKALNADTSSADTAVLESYTDADGMTEEIARYIAYAVNSKLAVGYDGKLNLSDNVTRAETAALIHRAMLLKAE